MELNDTARQAGKERRAVFVTGMVRCGSSWVGRVLAGGAGTRYVYEPFNPSWSPQLKTHWRQFTYLGENDPAPARLASVADAAFAGRQGLKLRGRALYRGYLWSTLRPARRVLVKDPTACLASPWLHAHHQPRMVLITRHPCGFASSIDLHGWQVRLRTLLRQPRLMDDHLGAFEDLMVRAEKDDWLRLGAFWAAVHLVLGKWWQRHPDWTCVRYEDLCREPHAAFARLADNCGLAFSARALANTVSGKGDPADSGTTRRDSTGMQDVWRQRLSPMQIDAVMGMVQAFGLPPYALPAAEATHSG